MKEQQTSRIEKEKRLEIQHIEETPFKYIKDNEKCYIACGRVIIETAKDKEEVKEWINQKPWELIGIFIQAITDELIKENAKK